MPVTISGNLSSTPNSTNVVNNSGVFISVQDDLQSSSGTNIDCSLDCKSAIFNNTTFGESDSFGATKRVIINVFGNLDGWNSFLPGYPGRTLVRFIGNCTIKNATFVYRGGAGTNQHNSADGLMSWGWDGGVFGESIDTTDLVLENVEIIAPRDFSEKTGYWDSGGTAVIKATRIDGLSVRNLSTVGFSKNPTFARNIKIINASWGAEARVNVSLTGLDSTNFLLQEGAIVSLTDSRVVNLRWFTYRASTDSGYKFLKTFKIAISGFRKNIKVICFDKQGNSLINTVSGDSGLLENLSIDYLYVSQASSGTPNSQSLPGFPVSYPIPNNKVVYNKLPVVWSFIEYSILKQSVTISEINHTLESNLKSLELSVITVQDTYITSSEATVRAFTSINNLSDLYDALKVFSVDNPHFPDYNTQIAVAIGETLNLRYFNLVVDKNATLAIDCVQESNTIIIKSDALNASPKFRQTETTGTISILNGAKINVPYKDFNGIAFKFFDLPNKARIRITRVSDGSKQYVSTDVNGEANIILPPTDFIARADAYLYYRGNDIPFNAASLSLRLPLEPYRDKNGNPIVTINPNLSEVGLIRFEYDTTQVFISYSPDNPTINRDALLYALEKFQSGFNPDIPGSDDRGLNIEKPIRFQNEQFIADSDTTVKFLGEPTNNPSNRPYLKTEIIHLGFETPWGLFDTSNGRSILLPSGQVISPQVSVSGGFTANDRNTLVAISNDSRLNFLDAFISTRATKNDVQPTITVDGGFTVSDRTKLSNLDAPITSITTQISSIPTLTAASVASLPIEPGWPFLRVLRLSAAILGGVTTGTPNNPVFNRVGSTQPGVTSTISETGNRTSVTYNLD